MEISVDGFGKMKITHSLEQTVRDDKSLMKGFWKFEGRFYGASLVCCRTVKYKLEVTPLPNRLRFGGGASNTPNSCGDLEV